MPSHEATWANAAQAHNAQRPYPEEAARAGRTRPMGPPSCASGATWPMQKPWEPPEKRPSVMSAQSWPRPAPMMALVGVSISGMPGPPLGPS